MADNIMVDSCQIQISDLPDELIFHIFSYLDERDQIVFGQVCQHWYAVTNYDHHWNKMLQRDIGICNISKVTSIRELNEYPPLFSDRLRIKAVIWDPTVISKRIFTMCSPKIISKKRRLKLLKESELQSSLISRFKLLWKSPTPEVEAIPKWLMFGPGLETPGISVIVKKILKSRSNLFQIVEMINGGVVAMKFEDQLVHITFLYSNVKALRESLPAQERLESSRLFKKMSDKWVPTDPVKAACQGASCIIYAIDATSEIENVDDPFPDLTSVIQQTCVQYQNEMSNEDNIVECFVYLLVLVCIPDENSPRPDWQQLINRLNLWKYGIPWQVCLVIASSLANIDVGFNWAASRFKYCGSLQENKSTEIYTVKI